MKIRTAGMAIDVIEVAQHRNGVGGAPFHVVRFTQDRGAGGEFVGIVFDAKAHVAVLHVPMLATGSIKFGENSWRGDQYESALRQAVAAYEMDEAAI